jgi:hypothetical protein
MFCTASRPLSFFCPSVNPVILMNDDDDDDDDDDVVVGTVGYGD